MMMSTIKEEESCQIEAKMDTMTLLYTGEIEIIVMNLIMILTTIDETMDVAVVVATMVLQDEAQIATLLLEITMTDRHIDFDILEVLRRHQHHPLVVVAVRVRQRRRIQMIMNCDPSFVLSLPLDWVNEIWVNSLRINWEKEQCEMSAL